MSEEGRWKVFDVSVTGLGRIRALGGSETRFRSDPGSGLFGDEIRGGVWFSASRVARGGVLKYSGYRIRLSATRCTS